MSVYDYEVIGSPRSPGAATVQEMGDRAEASSAPSSKPIDWFVPPPRTPKAAATRERLLEVASDLFVSHGYAAVSMRDVATAAHMTKGGVYGHFRSKGQLLMEVIRWRLASREHSAYFTEMMSDRDRAIGLLYDEDGREIRILGVDAAAAARHDADVAAGLAGWNHGRQASIRAAVASAGVTDTETVAWLISALSAGIAMKEAQGLYPPDTERLHAVLLSLLHSLENPPRQADRRQMRRRRDARSL